jgi:hypothetical protein
MSLGDYLRFLRAKHGGESTLKIAEALGLQSPWPINEIEQRYRDAGSEELVAKLAEYYEVPLEELTSRRARSRKSLTAFLNNASEEGLTVMLLVRPGQRLQGTVDWFDMGAVKLAAPSAPTETIVQRHMIDDWELA